MNLLDPLLAEYREFGPAYVVHARVFLMAGDAAQPLVDLDAAEAANREYGTPEQMDQVHEARALAHAVRSLYGGKTEGDKCRAAVEELIRRKCAPRSQWFLPALCLESAYKAQDAEAWVRRMAKFRELEAAAGFFFQRRAGLTEMLAMPKNPEEMIPVHFARHLRARRDGDKKSAEKYLKRMTELLKPGDPWSVLALYATGETTLAAM